MTPRTLIHTALLMAVITAVGTVAIVPRAPAAERQIPGVSLVGNRATTLPINVAVGKSRVYDFQRTIKEVLLGDPKIADVVIRSSTRAYIEARKLGATNISFFDAEGRQMARFEITVARDVSIIQDAIQKLLCSRRDIRCEADVKVESIGDGIILTGTVATQAQAQQAYNIALHFIATGSDFASSSTGSSGVGGSTGSTLNVSATNGGSASSNGANSANGDNSAKVYNGIVVLGSEQVMLKVTVAEMDRQVIKQLGINLSGNVGYGTAVVNLNSTNPFPVNGTP